MTQPPSGALHSAWGLHLPVKAVPWAALLTSTTALPGTQRERSLLPSCICKCLPPQGFQGKCFLFDTPGDCGVGVGALLTLFQMCI